MKDLMDLWEMLRKAEAAAYKYRDCHPNIALILLQSAARIRRVLIRTEVSEDLYEHQVAGAKRRPSIE